jgi:hypothetical protein
MEDLLWIEIADAPGEVFEIPELWEDDEEDSEQVYSIRNKIHSLFENA